MSIKNSLECRGQVGAVIGDGDKHPQKKSPQTKTTAVGVFHDFGLSARPVTVK